VSHLIEHMPFTTGDAFGSSAKVGLVVLSSDYTLEHEFRQVFNTPATDFFTARIANSPEVTPATLADMQGRIAATVELLLPGDTLDVVAYCCTSASVVLGEEEVFRLIRTVQPQAQCTTPITAAFAAFRALSAKRIAVITPYQSDVNQHIIRYFLDAGFEVPVFGSFNEPLDPVVARIDLTSLENAAREVLDQGQADMLFVSCTSIRMLEAVASLEKKLGLPVTSSNHAMAWHCSRLAGTDEKRPELGQLYTH